MKFKQFKPLRHGAIYEDYNGGYLQYIRPCAGNNFVFYDMDIEDDGLKRTGTTTVLTNIEAVTRLTPITRGAR